MRRHLGRHTHAPELGTSRFAWLRMLDGGAMSLPESVAGGDPDGDFYWIGWCFKATKGASEIAVC